MGKRKKSFAGRLSLKIVLATSLLFLTSLLVMSAFIAILTVVQSLETAKAQLEKSTRQIESVFQNVELLTQITAKNLQLLYEKDEQLSQKTYFKITRDLARSFDYSKGCGIYFEPYAFDKEHYFSGFYSMPTQGDTITYIQAIGAKDDPEFQKPNTYYFGIEWYKKAKESGKPQWIAPYVEDGLDGEWSVYTYAYPLRNKNGEIFAVMVVDLSLEWLEEELNSIRPYHDSNALIVDENYNYICNPLSKGRNWEGSLFDTPFISGQTKMLTKEEIKDFQWTEMGSIELNMNKHEDIERSMEYDGDKDTNNLSIGTDSTKSLTSVLSNDSTRTKRVDWIWHEDYKDSSICIIQSMSNNWLIMMASKVTSVFWPIFGLLYCLGFVAVIGLITLFFVNKRIIHRHTRPLVDFACAASKITEGKFDIKLPEMEINDEVAEMHNALKSMQTAVIDHIAKLKATMSEKERLSSELNIAHNIQMQMLTNVFPNSNRLEMYAYLRPAKEVGGDLYDCYLNNNELSFILGDVSGKGVPAALLMATIQNSFRILGHMQLDADTLMGRINKSLCSSNNSGMFATMFYGHLNVDDGSLTYCNAGHNPIVVIPPTGDAYFLKARPNLACGVLDSFDFQAEQLTLERGTRLIIYSDGVTEAERNDRTQFGEERLLHWAHTLNQPEESPSSTPKAIVENLFANVRSFIGDAEQNDDITIMCIKY